MNTNISKVTEFQHLVKEDDIQIQDIQDWLLQTLNEGGLPDTEWSRIVQQIIKCNLQSEILNWLQECDEKSKNKYYDLVSALLNIKAGNIQLGLNTMEKIQEQMELSSQTYQLCAQFLAEANHFFQATDYQRLSFKDQPPTIQSKLLLGAYHWFANQQEDAKTIFTEVYEQIQENITDFFELPPLRRKTLNGDSFADLLDNLRDNPEQLRENLAQLNNANNDPNILYNQALLYGQICDWENAAKYIDLALEKNPNEIGIESAQAIIYYHSGNIHQTLGYLQRNLSRNKNNFKQWVCLGFIHQELNSDDQALKAFYESFRLKKDPVVLLCIIHLYQEPFEEMYDVIAFLLLHKEVSELDLDILPYSLSQKEKILTLDELGDDLLQHPNHWKIQMYLTEVKRQKAWNKALPVAETLIETFPGQPQNHFLLAEVYHGLGMTTEAEEQVRAAVAVAPTEKDRQADIYFHAGARWYRQWKMFEQAIETLQRAYELDPTPETALNLSLSFRDQSSIEDALEILESAKEKFPQNERILSHLARIYGECKEYEKAEVVYNELLSFASKSSKVEVYRDRGLMYKNDDPQKAIQAFKQAIHLDDGVNLALYNNLIEIYLSEEESEEQIKQALSFADEFIAKKGGGIHRGTLDMYFRKGNIYKTIGKIPEAIAVFNLVSQRGNATQRYSALISLGEIYLDTKKDLEKAQKILEKAAKIEAGQRALYLLLQAYEEAENFEKAIDVLRKLRHKRPENPSILDRLGKALLKTGEIDEALEVFNQALEFRPDDISRLLNLIEAYIQSGKIDSAKSLLQKVDDASLNMAQNDRFAEIYTLLSNQYDSNSPDFQKYKCISLIYQATSIPDDLQRLSLLESAKQYADALQEYVQQSSHLSSDEHNECTQLQCYVAALIESHQANQSEPWTDEHITHLEKAKDSFYRAGRQKEGEKYKFLLKYAHAQSAIQNKEYDKAGEFLQKAFEIRQRLDIPGIIHTPESLEIELKQLRALQKIGQHNFVRASDYYQDCLAFLESGSREYFMTQLRQLYTRCLSINPEEEEQFNTYFNEIEKVLGKASTEVLETNLMAILSLTHSYMVLKSNSQFVQSGENNTFLEKEIIPRIVEIATGLQLRTEQKRRQESQEEIFKRPWLLRLPRQIYDRLEEQRYRLDWAKTDNEKASALSKIHVNIEKCTAIVVEEAAKILYQDDWEEKLHELTNISTSFNILTWGGLKINLLYLNNLHEQKLPWMDLSINFFEKLAKHIKIRNDYIHEEFLPSNFAQIYEETSLLFEELISCFPIFFKVMNEEFKKVEDGVVPFYDVEMLWNYPLRKYSLKSPNPKFSLTKDKIYCLPPNVIVQKEQPICPKAEEVLENQSFEKRFLMMNT